MNLTNTYDKLTGLRLALSCRGCLLSSFSLLPSSLPTSLVDEQRLKATAAGNEEGTAGTGAGERWDKREGEVGYGMF